MAQFIGFKCDSCGNIIDTEDRNKVTTRFDGPAAKGEFSEDRCSDCTVVPSGVDLKPLRRRRTKAEVQAEARAQAEPVEQGDPTPVS